MTVRIGRTYAILLGRESRFPAQVAYILAHELGHVALRHVVDTPALMDVEDPLKSPAVDEEEVAADRFALELLTGHQQLDISANVETFSARQLADAALRQASQEAIEPGILALCLGHATGKWRQAFGALKIIPPGEVDVTTELNGIARDQLGWSSLPFEARDYLNTVMDGSRAP
jgi:hypothetical protein